MVSSSCLTRFIRAEADWTSSSPVSSEDKDMGSSSSSDELLEELEDVLDEDEEDEEFEDDSSLEPCRQG